jgi:hypothetical protein
VHRVEPQDVHRLKDASAASLHPAIQAKIALGSTLTADFWKGYLERPARATPTAASTSRGRG